MSFVFPELIIESIIKDGLENARSLPSAIDDVFGNLTRSFSSAKYGQTEIDKIHKVIQEKEVSVVHSFNLVHSKMPCISIQLISDTEDERQAHLGDYVSTVDEPYTDPQDIASTVIVESFQPSSYNPKTGVVTVPDSVNLADVYANLLFIDSAGVEHTILGGIVNDLGKKQFIIGKNSDVALTTGAEIRTSINFRRYQKKGNIEQVSLLIGVHTKDALLTKYLYTLVKYFILSRKADLISRDFLLSTYQGTDFNRNMEYKADVIYTRSLTISGTIQPDWRSDLVQLVDNVKVQIEVEKDMYGNEELGLEDSTVKVTEIVRDLV
jgi:hypothetical protein